MGEIPMNSSLIFSVRSTVAQVEEAKQLAPKFGADGFITCVTTAAATGDLLMVGYMNREALTLTIQTSQAHYWSRSRNALWHKGAISGLTQDVVEMRIDDDQDAAWLRVNVAGSGASCHVGYRSCFYRAVKPITGHLRFVESAKTFDPAFVYGDIPNPTYL